MQFIYEHCKQQKEGEEEKLGSEIPKARANKESSSCHTVAIFVCIICIGIRRCRSKSGSIIGQRDY